MRVLEKKNELGGGAMPIIGLTDHESMMRGRVSSLPLVGRLNKGSEKQDGGNGKKIMGKDLDYFRFTGVDEIIQEAFCAIFGDKPRSIGPIFVQGATPHEAFPTWCEAKSSSGKVVHKCDGQTMFFWRELGGKLSADGRPKFGSKPCPGGHKNNDPQEDSSGQLDLIISPLTEALGYAGTVTLYTHSKNDIPSILASLMNVWQDGKVNLRDVAFMLMRVTRQVNAPGWGKNKGKTIRVWKELVKLYPVPRSSGIVAMRYGLSPEEIQTRREEASRRLYGDGTLLLDETESGMNQKQEQEQELAQELTSGRPYNLAALTTYLRSGASKQPDTPVSDGKRGAVVGQINKILQPHYGKSVDAARRKLLKAVCGVASSKDLSAEWVITLTYYLKQQHCSTEIVGATAEIYGQTKMDLSSLPEEPEEVTQ